MPDERLDVESLHLWRGDRHVLRGVCFSLASGECLQVTGPNGSGKTSLLRTVCGLMYPEAGRVLWEGRDVRSDLRTFHCALVYLGHEPPLKADLSARENLRYWIGVRHRVGAAALEDALERVGANAWCARSRLGSDGVWHSQVSPCRWCRCGCWMNRRPISIRRDNSWWEV